MARKWDVLLPEEMDESGPKSITDIAEVTWLSEYSNTDELLGDIGRYDAMIVRASSLTVTAELLDSADNLKIISKHGVGVDNIDIDAASARNIIVCNTPGANSQAVAEHTIALVLAVRKNLLEANNDVREGNWNRNKYATSELRQSTLGVFGCGDIGRLTTEFAAGIGMDCLAYDPYLSDEDVPAHVDKVEAKRKLFEASDIVCVHAPLTEETRGTVSTEELRSLGPSGILVNTSRGGLVDEDALVSALKADELAGAGVDVFHEEPPGSDHPLFAFKNVVVTPHIAGTTTTSARKKSLRAAENIRTVYGGETPKSALNLGDLFDVENLR